MDITRYLAVTAWEYSQATYTTPIAWMACHFSPYETGLSNIPDNLPRDSMVILNDRTPPNGHDQGMIADQLNRLGDLFQIKRFLLDFQRENDPETISLVAFLTEKVIGSVAVTEKYAKHCNSPVFISCPLPHQTLSYSISKWKNRELWLELGTESEIITICKNDYNCDIFQELSLSEKDYIDTNLHCRYRTDVFDNCVRLTLERSEKELDLLMNEAEKLGIKIAVGLFQQFK